VSFIYHKLHYELNFIERVWALLKNIPSHECEWSFASLQVKVPEVKRQISEKLADPVTR